VSARVALHSFSSDDVEVQVPTGLVDADGIVKNPGLIPRLASERVTAENYLFQIVAQPSAERGLRGRAVRLLPKHTDSVSLFLPGLIKWAQALSPVAELQAR
jgi:hypothetical protein